MFDNEKWSKLADEITQAGTWKRRASEFSGNTYVSGDDMARIMVEGTEVQKGAMEVALRSAYDAGYSDGLSRFQELLNREAADCAMLREQLAELRLVLRIAKVEG